MTHSKLKILSDSQSPTAGIDAILESATSLRAKMESAADPGYGYGQASGKAPAAGAKPKFTKKPKA